MYIGLWSLIFVCSYTMLCSKLYLLQKGGIILRILFLLHHVGTSKQHKIGLFRAVSCVAICFLVSHQKVFRKKEKILL
jgi:hypothetical protein